jgi:hypothetical protein
LGKARQQLEPARFSRLVQRLVPKRQLVLEQQLV